MPPPPDTPVETINDLMIQESRRQYPDLTLAWINNLTLSGETWLQSGYSLTNDKGAIKFQDQLISIVDGTAYVILESAPAYQWNQELNNFLQPMLNSFAFSRGYDFASAPIPSSIQLTPWTGGNSSEGGSYWGDIHRKSQEGWQQSQ